MKRTAEEVFNALVTEIEKTGFRPTYDQSLETTQGVAGFTENPEEMHRIVTIANELFDRVYAETEDYGQLIERFESFMYSRVDTRRLWLLLSVMSIIDKQREKVRMIKKAMNLINALGSNEEEEEQKTEVANGPIH